MAVAVDLTPEEQIREQLRWDTVLFAPNCCQIIPKAGGRPVWLEPKPEQARLDAALEAQRAAGLPMRAIILKARQIGFSTWIQAKLIQRVTQNPYHTAMVLAQLNRTSEKLFRMGYRMWQGIPDEADLKPRKSGGRKARLLELANHSTYESASAKEFEGGRGDTIHSVHASEPAFYPDAERKLTGLLEAVPEEPDTLVVLESTAFGANYFKDLWDAAESGKSDYIAFFSPWFREATYRWPFANEQEHLEFVASIGKEAIGEDEPGLIALMEAEGYQLAEIHMALNWRRRKIRGFKGDVDKFHQEYPSTPAEAFLTTGRYVFSVQLRQAASRAASEAPRAQTGVLEAAGAVRKASRGALVEVPYAPITFKPRLIDDERDPGWMIWEHPQQEDRDNDIPEGQYIIGVDASGGDEEEEGTTAYHAIQVINHRTRMQVAEYRSLIDPDVLAYEVYLACLYWNRPWAAIEITGSWGGPAARRLWNDFAYLWTYRRPKSLAATSESPESLLGWDTTKATKGHLIAGATELLREGTHGVRSPRLAGEIGAYIRDKRGRMKPESGKTSDLFMAWSIAQEVANEKPLRPRRKPGDVTSTLQGARVNPRTGYRV